MTRRVIEVDERPPLLVTIPLSLQHLFAMFGATVLVPILFQVNPPRSCYLTVSGRCCICLSVKEKSRRIWAPALPLFHRC